MRCSVMVALTSGMSNTCRADTFTALHPPTPLRSPHTQRAHGRRRGVRRLAAPRPKSLPTGLLTRLPVGLTLRGARRAAFPPITRRRLGGVLRVLPQPALELHNPRLQILDHRVPLRQLPEQLLNGGRGIRHRASRPATTVTIKPPRRSHRQHQSHQGLNGYDRGALATESNAYGGYRNPRARLSSCVIAFAAS